MLREYTDFGKKTLFDSISTSRSFPNGLLAEVILTLTDNCNRKCNYCPYGNKYASPHANRNISIEVLDKICNDLGNSFDGYISFSGFGEPTLNAALNDILEKVANSCKNAKMLLHTNGDNVKMLCNLPYLRQLDVILSMHSKLKSESLQCLKALKNQFFLKDTTVLSSRYINNRATNANVSNQQLSLPLERCCNIPCYKMSVDINGDVILCCSDWHRTMILGNVLTDNIYSIWNNSKYREIRTQLIRNDRSNKLCEKCSADGMITGNAYVEQWKKIYQITE